MSQQYGRVDAALVVHHHFRGLSVEAKLLCELLNAWAESRRAAFMETQRLLTAEGLIGEVQGITGRPAGKPALVWE